KVVRIPLEGDEILRVHGERTQGVMKTLMNTKVGESKLSDISVIRDFIDVFPEDLSMTTAMTRAPMSFVKKEEHGVHLKLELELLRKEKLYAKVTYLRFIANFSKIVKPLTTLTVRNQKYEWGAKREEKGRVRVMSMTIQSSVKDKILATLSETSKYEYEIRYHPGKANVVIEALRRKERVKTRRVRAMAMTIQYGVREMILVAQSEAFKQENGMMRTVVMDEAHASSKEWNSGDDQLRLRWMIYLVVLADAAESVRDTIGFEYCLASSSG
ncbi:hypothetical protein Tco_1060245, partial [Tanacetum coccineum]